MIFYEIKDGKQLAQFSVGKDIATVEWTYYLDGDAVSERSAVHIMIGRMKSSMKRADDGIIIVTDLIPKFEGNKESQKLALLLTGTAILSGVLLKKIVDNSEAFFGVADLSAKETKVLHTLIASLEEAGPVLDKLKIDPDKKKL